MFQMRCSRENLPAVCQIFDSLLRQIIKEESGDSSKEEGPLYMSDSLPGAEDEEVRRTTYVLLEGLISLRS